MLLHNVRLLVINENCEKIGEINDGHLMNTRKR